MNTKEPVNKKNGSVFWIDVRDKNAEIKPVSDISGRYFNLLAAIFGERSLYTYSIIADNYEMYLKKTIDLILNSLKELEQDVIRNRFGLNSGIARTLEEVAADYNVTKERIRQKEASALRKMRHPSNAYSLINVFYNPQACNYENSNNKINYGALFERILKEEIIVYKENGNVSFNTLLFGKILASPRFNCESIDSNSYVDKDIETLELSDRNVTCLRRAGINSIREVIKLTPDNLMKVRNLGRRGFEEIQEKLKIIKNEECNKKNDIDHNKRDFYDTPIEQLDLSVNTYICLKQAGISNYRDLVGITPQDYVRIPNLDGMMLEEIINHIKIVIEMAIRDKKSIEQFELDANSIFSHAGETLITRTNLPASDMLRLLQQGFLYVSDYLQYYDVIIAKYNEEIKGPILCNKAQALRMLLGKYSSPVFRLFIPANVRSEMIRRNITTIKQLETEYHSFPTNIMEETKQVIQEVEEAYEKIKTGSSEYVRAFERYSDDEDDNSNDDTLALFSNRFLQFLLKQHDSLILSETKVQNDFAESLY